MISNQIPNADYVYLEKFCSMDIDEISLGNFQYDFITDEDIDNAINNTVALNKVDPNIDWEDDSYLYQERNIPDDIKHSYRVAALVKSIEKDGIQSPIEFDTFFMDRCLSSIPNGHHRIRALQYLKIDIVPFSMNGHLDIIEPILKFAGVEGFTPTLNSIE